MTPPTPTTPGTEAALREALERIAAQPTLIRHVTDSVMRTTEHEVLSAYDVRNIVREALAALPAAGSEAVGVVPEGFALVPTRLTAENGAKAALIGEFRVRVRSVDDYGDEQSVEVLVPWATIKGIWAAGIAHFATGSAPA